VPNLRVKPFRQNPYKENYHPGYDSQPAKCESYFLFVSIPKVNQASSNQNGLDGIYEEL
jgi:hypothetical protein